MEFITANDSRTGRPITTIKQPLNSDVIRATETAKSITVPAQAPFRARITRPSRLLSFSSFSSSSSVLCVYKHIQAKVASFNFFLTLLLSFFFDSYIHFFFWLCVLFLKRDSAALMITTMMMMMAGDKELLEERRNNNCTYILSTLSLLLCRCI